MKKRKSKTIIKLFLLLIILSLTLCVIFVIKSQDNSKKSIKKPKKEEKIVEKKEEPKEKRMSLFAVGDVLIHEKVFLDAYNNGSYDFSNMFTYIEPIMKEYDLKYCNQESTIGGKQLGITGYPSFNSPDEIGDELIRLGFNLISLANNHALDRGMDAVLYSNSYWKGKNVITAGAYSSKEERDEAKVYEQNGIKYAFLAYTTLSNSWVPNDYIINMYDEERVKNDIEKVRDQVDVIIVSMHWGEEYTNVPTSEEKEIAKYLSDLGVNVVIGAHPHVVQPIEYIGNTLVIYSLGNFISNQLSIADSYAYDTNPGIGLMVGVDIVLTDEGVKFENLYKELILAYAENSTNFKVIPFSKLNNDLFANYEKINGDYMNIVNGG